MTVHEKNTYRDIALNAAHNQIERVKATPPANREMGASEIFLDQLPEGELLQLLERNDDLWSVRIRVSWVEKKSIGNISLWTNIYDKTER